MGGVNERLYTGTLFTLKRISPSIFEQGLQALKLSCFGKEKIINEMVNGNLKDPLDSSHNHTHSVSIWEPR